MEWIEGRREQCRAVTKPCETGTGGHLLKLVEVWLTQEAENFQNKLPDEVTEADGSLFKTDVNELMDNKSINIS